MRVVTQIAVLYLALLVAPTVTAQNQPVKYEMKTYFLVLLKRGPMHDQDSATVMKIQEGHLANIQRLADAGKLDIAGPFLHDGDLRGIFVLNVSTYEEAKALCDTDPAIKAGRLIAEIYPWFAAKGSILR